MNNKKQKKSPLEVAESLSKIEQPYFSFLNPEKDVKVDLKPSEWEDINQAVEYLKEAYTPKTLMDKLNYLMRFFPLIMMLMMWTIISCYQIQYGLWNFFPEVFGFYVLIIVWFGIGYYRVYIRKKKV